VSDLAILYHLYQLILKVREAQRSQNPDLGDPRIVLRGHALVGSGSWTKADSAKMGICQGLRALRPRRPRPGGCHQFPGGPRRRRAQRRQRLWRSYARISRWSKKRLAERELQT